MSVLRRLAVAALPALLAGCAPFAEYHAPAPAPAPPTTLAAATTRTVLIYGDNRPGFRLEAQRWEHHALTHWGSIPPWGFFRGLIAVPVAIAEALLPPFNGPRDFVTLFTRRHTGGGEMRVIRAMEREPRADLVVSTGDIVTDGRRGRLWRDFAGRIRSLRARSPYIVAPGNHERLYDARSRASWVAAVASPPAPDRFWGVVDDPATQSIWVYLDSDVLTDPHDNRNPESRRRESRAQLDWCDSVLARPAHHRFVMLHHPLVSAGHYLSDWSRSGEHEAAANRARLLAMCLERGVTAVFAGHEHLYQRLWLAGPGGRGFWHITTGGGGAPLYLIERREREKAWNEKLPAGLAIERSSIVTRSAYHYCRLSLATDAAAPGAAALPLTALSVSIGGDATPFDSLDVAKAWAGSPTRTSEDRTR